MNESPRVLPLIGGIVALVGALVSLAAVFPDYYDDGFARRLEPGPRWFVVFFVSGVVAGGLLLLARRGTQLAGSCSPCSPSSASPGRPEPTRHRVTARVAPDGTAARTYNLTRLS